MGFYYSTTVKGRKFNSGDKFICANYVSHGYHSSDGYRPLSIPLFAGASYVFKYYADYDWSIYRYGIAFDPTADYSKYPEYAQYQGKDWDIGWFSDICFTDYTQKYNINYYDSNNQLKTTQQKTMNKSLLLLNKAEAINNSIKDYSTSVTRTITFNGGGIINDTTTRITAKTNYDLISWKTSNNIRYDFGATYTADTNLNLYPNYTISGSLPSLILPEPSSSTKIVTDTTPTKVQYNLNGSGVVGTTPNTRVVYNKTKYYFDGWSRNFDVYKPGYVINNVTENITFTATWKQEQILSTIELSNGSGFSRPGYIFIGWGSSSDATTPVATTYTPTRGVTTTLYAIWVSSNIFDGIRITFNDDIKSWKTSLINKVGGQTAYDNICANMTASTVTNWNTAYTTASNNGRVTATHGRYICKFIAAFALAAGVSSTNTYYINVKTWGNSTTSLGIIISSGSRIDSAIKQNIEGLIDSI